MKPVAIQGPPFVLVTGGKGGVGKTTLAANLGVRLARDGVAPLVADLDFGLADLAVVLGLEPDRDVDDLLDGREPLERCLARGPHGLRILSAGSRTPGAVDDVGAAERCERLLGHFAAARPAERIVIGDSPAGIGPDVLAFADRADRVLVVTTPEPAAMTDAYCVFKALDARGRGAGRDLPTPELFVNLAADAAEARSVAGRLRSVCARFLNRSPRLVGWMPRTRSVVRAALRQEAFVVSDPRSAASRSLRQLARRFSDLVAAPAAAPGAPKAPACHVR